MTADAYLEDGTGLAPLDDPFDVMYVGWSFLRSRLLVTALELGVFTTLADRSRSAD